MFTITTDSAFGIRCRNTSRVRPLPITRAAPTKSRVAQRQHLAAHQARGDQPREEAEQQALVEHGRAELRRQHEHDEQERDRQQDVDEAHHDPVDQAAGEARDAPRRACRSRSR